MEDAAHKGMEAMDKALEEEDDDRSKWWKKNFREGGSFLHL
jgi:hypothetical protein